MAKKRKQDTRKTRKGKAFTQKFVDTAKINASTRVETCDAALSPFGGLLAVVRFLDLVQFKQNFDSDYTKPTRDPANGHYFMVKGILLLASYSFSG